MVLKVLVFVVYNYRRISFRSEYCTFYYISFGCCYEFSFIYLSHIIQVATETSTESVTNTTKSNLTGNPQIDYLLDPNLPQELNGYNLSEYPFYERVPDEEIDFKCDGLHDGFYASVPHKCQVRYLSSTIMILHRLSLLQ